MTEPKHVPPAFGGVPVHRRLLIQSHELAVSIVDTLAGQLPVYQALPSGDLRGDIVRAAEQSIRAFAETLQTGRLPDAEALTSLRESAAKRAEAGVPLEMVFGACHLGAELGVQRVTTMAGPHDLEAVLRMQRLLLRFLRQLTSAVAAGYLQERQAAFGEEHSAREALLAALLAGASARDAAERSGLGLPASYLVLSISVNVHRDERTSPLMTGQRRLRRLRMELERHVRGTVLSRLSADGGLALVPCDTPPGELTERHWGWLKSVISHVTGVCDEEITAGAVAAEPRGVAEAARLAAEVRHVAVASGRPPGVYRLADVLLEYQLTRPGPARDELAALLSPLADRPELTGTLRTYLSCGLSRRDAAERLNVHPNTIDYRLRKVATLIGLDVTNPSDVLRIQAALVAHDAPPATAGADLPG